MLSGDNSILQKATEAKTSTEKVNEKEQIQMEVLGSLNKNGKLEIAIVNSNIKSNISGVTTDDATEFPLTVTYTLTGNSYSVDEDGNVEKAVIYPLVSNTLKAGDYVEYNNEPYIVLYDMDSEFNWVEIISVNPQENVTLGHSDQYDSNMGIYEFFPDALNSYNNAITTLNNKALAYLDTDLADRARCVGSNPQSPDSESNYISNSGTYNYFVNIKGEDSNYQKDFNQLQNINSKGFNDENYTSYWLASRVCNNPYGSDNHYYGLRTVQNNGTQSVGNLIFVYLLSDKQQVDANDRGLERISGLRPVIRLISTTKIVDGDGSIGSPYKLQK